MTTATITAKRANHNYAPQWFAVLAIVGLFVTAHWMMERRDYPLFTTSAPVTPAHSDWFMILRMPEVPSSVTDDESTRQVFAKRLEGLLEQGFHPILLSEIHERLLHHQALPSKPVVLLFEPASRHTYEMLHPVFLSYKCPIVWTVNRHSLDNSERPYLSRHALNLMMESGQYDVATYDENHGLVVRNRDTSFPIGSSRADIWGALVGTSSFNAYGPKMALHRLNRLNVNPTWTQEEFIDRVLAEVPVRETVHLGGHMIGSRLWGITLPATAPANDTTFTLEAPLDRRGMTLSWLGTRGIQNAQLNLTVEKASGEIWVLMRSDEQSGEAVRVGFASNNVLVEQESNHFARRLTQATVPLTMPLRIAIRLSGPRLVISVNDRKIFDLSYIQPSKSRRGAMRLTVYDKIRGTAQAVNVQALMTPLGSS